VGLTIAGVRNVSGGEVAVSVNNLTGTVSLEEREGLHFTIPYLTTFYVLDRTTKPLEMLAAPPGSTGVPDDYVNVKAKEGDNVKIDVKVQFRIVSAKAVDVLRFTGAESLLNKGVESKWVRPLVRAALLDRFNELTREEMNDGVKRAEKAELARVDVNKELVDRFGIEVQTITVENPSSYTQYELIVRQRKDTDQEVNAIIKQQDQEKEAQKKQETQELAAKTVEISKAEATAKRMIDEANARKTKAIEEAQGNLEQTKGESDGKLKQNLATAAGKRKQGEAEADGIRSLASALSGPNGSSLIAAEFAKRLKDIQITAGPFIYNAMVQPYILEQGSGKIPVPGTGPSPSAPTAAPPAPRVN